MKVSYVILLLGVFLFSCNEKEKTASKEEVKQERLLIFEEEFNDSLLNTATWSYDLGDGCPNLCGWGNNERQLYSKENVTLSDGKLLIEATKRDSLYYSGKIHTKKNFEFQYGTVEVKAKLPTGHGLWPAIWMLGNDIDTKGWPACGEIDVMEYVGKKPSVIYTSMHTSSSFGNTVNSKQTSIQNIEEGFHVYKMNWTKEAITFFIDNKEVYQYAPKDKNDKTWPYNKPFYLILNMAIGGNFGGPEVDESIFPKDFQIDYIRVYNI